MVKKFYRLVVKHRAERYSKGYNSWDHFTAMLFCQLAQAKSLREICGSDTLITRFIFLNPYPPYHILDFLENALFSGWSNVLISVIWWRWQTDR